MKMAKFLVSHFDAGVEKFKAGQAYPLDEETRLCIVRGAAVEADMPDPEPVKEPSGEHTQAGAGGNDSAQGSDTAAGAAGQDTDAGATGTDTAAGASGNDTQAGAAAPAAAAPAAATSSRKR
jgi:hypothetical protein